MKSKRAENRDRVMAAIIDAGRRQLVDVGAAELSLRSIAREVGMVSSAVYRYVASRDDLLTRLIIDAFESLGDSIDASVDSTAGEPPTARWVAATHAVRDWAVARPEQYFLVFGSPVPGYEAPADTVTPGTRVPLALMQIIIDAAISGELTRPVVRQPVPDSLIDDFAALRAGVDELFGGGGPDIDIADSMLLDGLVGWMQMFGLISFELSHQTRGVVEHHRDFFETANRRTAARIGLK